jgi:glycosyltransferase involved in cell wall biosynthesis
MDNLAVSVVIPAYKAAHTIGRALDSLLTQTRPPDEILVVDDGSPDDMAAAVEPYGGRVTFLRKPNGGAASARNFGIDRAAGELIAFIDADDYWEPQKLERQLDVLRWHPEVGVIAGRSFLQAPGQPRDNPPEESRRYFNRVLRPHGAEIFTVARMVWTSMLLFRRSVLGANRFDPTLKTAQDIDVWVRLVEAAPTYLVWEPLATYVLEPGSLSRSNVAFDSYNMLRVLERNAYLLGWWHKRGWQAEVYQIWAAGHLAQGEPRKAMRPAWRRLVRQLWSPQAWWIVAKSQALSLRSPQ